MEWPFPLGLRQSLQSSGVLCCPPPSARSNRRKSGGCVLHRHNLCIRSDPAASSDPHSPSPTGVSVGTICFSQISNRLWCQCRC